MNALRRIFRLLNKVFMVPAFRMGLGPIICNPVVGYIMVIKNIGRKSGKTYFTPTNYAIIDGNVYCIAGFGKRSDWYRNIAAYRNVELILPGRAAAGVAKDVSDPEEALKACKQILKNAGFAGFFEGYNPWKAPNEKFQETLARAPVMRIEPAGIGSGPVDAGGWHWVTLILTILLIILLL